MESSSGITAAFTIASANYLPYVKTLMQSLRDTNPEYRRYFVLVDRDAGDLGEDGLFQTILAEDLTIEDFDDMALRYNVMELNTAVKPFAIDWLFKNTDASSVIYFDPDICVYRELTELDDLLKNRVPMVVTPHLTKPVEDGKLPNDHHMLQSGIFNLGFVAVNRCENSREFVSWWGRRLKTQGYADVSNSLFTDQKWVDLAPCFVKDLNILRSAAYNVAYWNLMQRPVSLREGELVYEDGPLAFFHFSGLESGKTELVSKHQDRLRWQDIAPYHKLFRSYRSRLKGNGWGAQGQTSYAYDQVDGLRVPSIVRSLYRELYPETRKGARASEPFLLAMCNAPARLPKDPEGRITRLMDWLYRNRPDLQNAFRLDTPEGIEHYRHWFETSAPREYGLDDRMARPHRITPADEAANYPIEVTARNAPNEGKPLAYRQWRKFRKWLIERL